jgi:hypothetical protein
MVRIITQRHSSMHEMRGGELRLFGVFPSVPRRPADKALLIRQSFGSIEVVPYKDYKNLANVVQPLKLASPVPIDPRRPFTRGLGEGSR